MRHFRHSYLKANRASRSDGTRKVEYTYHFFARTAHLTARGDKYVAYVTNNKRLYSTFCTVEANYWQTRSIARPLRQQSYLLGLPHTPHTHLPVFVCLSVSKISQNACMDLDEMLRVDRCRDMDELIYFSYQSGYSPDSGCRNRIAFSAIV